MLQLPWHSFGIRIQDDDDDLSIFFDNKKWPAAHQIHLLRLESPRSDAAIKDSTNKISYLPRGIFTTP